MMNTATPAALSSRKAQETRALAGSASSSPTQVSKRSPRMYRASAFVAWTLRKSRNCSIASGALASKCTSETKSRAMALVRWGTRRRDGGCRSGGRGCWSCCGCGGRRGGRGRRGARHDLFDFLDDDRLQGCIGLERPYGAGRHRADAIDHVHALDDATEDGITPAGRHRIKVRIIGDVDVELRVARVRGVTARKPDRAALILQAVAGLVEDGIVRRLQVHVARSMAAAP